MKTIFSFLVAPIFPMLVIFTFQLFTVGLSEALTLLLALAVIGYGVAATLGIPMHFVLRNKKIFTMRAYILGGALLGMIPYGLLFIPTYFSSVNTGHVFLLLKNTVGFGVLGAACGIFSSYVFWFFAVRGLSKKEANRM